MDACINLTDVCVSWECYVDMLSLSHTHTQTRTLRLSLRVCVCRMTRTKTAANRPHVEMSGLYRLHDWQCAERESSRVVLCIKDALIEGVPLRV
mmetsp:Transcript_547/g.1566  ORF Transcript_547/g.1566 Transcript_547/m.1566 type:complete len:94 (-) Transcript_547:188-469(-)